MTQSVTLAIDAMGGDFGPSVVLPGVEIALSRHSDLTAILVGDEATIRKEMAALPRLSERARIIHSDVSIRMDDKPSRALRYGRRVSSMWMALDCVKNGEAQAAISAGNTGALMAMAVFNLKLISGIERPALAALWPTIRGESVVLDMGASIGADAQGLVDMAVMGAAMARIVYDVDRPTVGLLNIGIEEVKGLESIREAGVILKETPIPGLNYHGFVEGSDIGKGVADVVVTEGFTGNIALKTAEGTAKQIGDYLRQAMSRNWRSKLGYLLAKPAFAALREKLDPRRANGGVFLGLNGLVVKSHGGADALGFASAMDIAYDMARYDLQVKIRGMLDDYQAQRQNRAVMASPAVVEDKE